MRTAKAINVDHGEPQPNLSAPWGETPVARPGFRRSMVFLVLLSVPLWALLGALVWGAVRVLG